MKRSISSVVAGEFVDERVQRRVHRARAEGGGEAHRLDPVIALADDLHEAELALHRIAREREIDDSMHRHQTSRAGS